MAEALEATRLNGGKYGGMRFGAHPPLSGGAVTVHGLRASVLASLG